MDARNRFPFAFPISVNPNLLIMLEIFFYTEFDKTRNTANVVKCPRIALYYLCAVAAAGILQSHADVKGG